MLAGIVKVDVDVRHCPRSLITALCLHLAFRVVNHSSQTRSNPQTCSPPSDLSSHSSQQITLRKQKLTLPSIQTAFGWPTPLFSSPNWCNRNRRFRVCNRLRGLIDRHPRSLHCWATAIRIGTTVAPTIRSNSWECHFFGGCCCDCDLRGQYRRLRLCLRRRRGLWCRLALLLSYKRSTAT